MIKRVLAWVNPSLKYGAFEIAVSPSVPEDTMILTDEAGKEIARVGGLRFAAQDLALPHRVEPL